MDLETRQWRRKMARFELAKARRLGDAGSLHEADLALTRAKLWRWDALRHTNHPAA